MGALILSKNYILPPLCRGNIICTDPYLPCLQGRWQNEVLTEGLLKHSKCHSERKRRISKTNYTTKPPLCKIEGCKFAPPKAPLCKGRWQNEVLTEGLLKLSKCHSERKRRISKTNYTPKPPLCKIAGCKFALPKPPLCKG